MQLYKNYRRLVVL